MSLLILYGSETGTAQDIAESLRREAEMRHLTTRVFGLDEFDIDSPKNEKTVLFIVSTTGQGEMPPNMRSAWRLLLRKSLGNSFLQGVSTAVLGLGDSSYQKYNFAGKKMYRRLIQLGASMITDLGLADDQHEIGIDGALVPWKTEVFSRLFAMGTFPGMVSEVDTSVIIKPKYRFSENLSFHNEGTVEQDYYGLKVIFNKRVTSKNHFQETRLVRLEIPSTLRNELQYQPGDVLMVRPYNPKETVQISIDAFGFSDEILDKPVRIERNNEFVKDPLYYLVGETTTLRTCLTRYFDLQQIPKRSFFEALAVFSTDEMEKERLTELASQQGLDDLLDYSTRCRRTTAETLRDFPATAKQLQPDQLFELLPVIRPRAFSIASKPSSEYIEILVAKVEYKSRMADMRRGLCSTFISRLEENNQVFCKIRAGTFKFPQIQQSVICVGPGTGVAPFRSLFGKIDGSDTNGVLFFGCRGKHSDFYFSNEWEQLNSLKVITAFSRDTDKKVYVQHKIRENSQYVWDLLEAGAMVFIAGSAGDMPKAVIEAIDDVAKQFGNIDKWVAKAEVQGKIQYETWT